MSDKDLNDKLFAIWATIVICFCILYAILLFGCTGPRYDKAGNGTSLCDRAAMSLGTFVNKQRPPSRWEHNPEEYRNK